MKTLNEEITRIKSEVAEIASKAFTGKTIEQRVNEAFAAITRRNTKQASRPGMTFTASVCGCGKNSKGWIYRFKRLKKSLADR